MEQRDSLSFNQEELMIIRELLSHIACGYERETFYFDCCDGNEIISKIDNFLKESNKKD